MIIGCEFRHREILHLGSFIDFIDDAYVSWAVILVHHYRVPGGRHSQIGQCTSTFKVTEPGVKADTIT
jgi:hypothetical protein